MTNDPFRDLVRAIGTSTDFEHQADLRLDPDRAKRTGIPEVVHAGHKSPEAISAALLGLVQANGRALASRVESGSAPAVQASLGPSLVFDHDPMARTIIVSDGTPVAITGGRVGVLCAGTSDLPVAREAAIMAREMGCEVREVADVGVAGLHRLVTPLRDLMNWQPHALIVAAGMDGALPSVVAGLVDIPVIGLPVSVGYGYGGDGTAALMSMLQSCAPGLAIVNIDNGIGAGSMAALIANRAIRSTQGT